MKRPDLIAVVPAFFVVSAVASIPAWIALSRRLGKRNVWMVAMVGNGIFFGSTFFLGEGDLALLCILLVGAGVSNGCGGAIGASMLADVIDYDELHSGERKEGAYSAAWGFAIKLAIGLVVMATGFALQLSGFEPNVEQTRTAELTLRGLFAGGPLLAAGVTVWILARFSLDEREHARIRGEIERRR
jgi:GPH family glycoside/pentoside/hexuronide:cation symporter